MANIKVTITVTATVPTIPVANAKVSLFKADDHERVEPAITTKNTDLSGICQLEIAPGDYIILAEAFTVFSQRENTFEEDETLAFVNVPLPLKVAVKTYKNGTVQEITFCDDGEIVDLDAIVESIAVAGGAGVAAVGVIDPANNDYAWLLTDGSLLDLPPQNNSKVHWDTTDIAGINKATATITDPNGASVSPSAGINVREGAFSQQRRSEPVNVSLRRANIDTTDDQALWVAIRNRTNAISFNAYKDFIDRVLCNDDGGLNEGLLEDAQKTNPRRNDARLIRQNKELYTSLHGVGAYELLKTATQVFLLLECGVAIEEMNRYTGKPLFKASDETTRLGKNIPLTELQNLLTRYLGSNQLPYIQTIIDNAFGGFNPVDSIFCSGYLLARANCPPLLELIWSYWHEEAMLAQTMNAIGLRFQNRRGAAVRDPLAHLEIAPLFPINNLLWGHIQEEQQRLSVPRRAYEYNHHYGLTLVGKAIPDFRPADARSKFLEAYHHLLYLCTVFYKQDDDTTVIADGFPVLNALKEVHLLLAEGAHNQFGDLPWTARAEMLTEQWILSRPEMRQFLLSRHMVPYREGWMGQVDTMKRLQGWTDVTVTHFNELAIYGEQILLAVRYGNWNIETDPVRAANWARYWRPEIQNYIHGYRAVTGVELRAEPTTNQQRELITTLPTLLIQQRLLTGKSAPALPAPMVTDTAKSFRERRASRRANSG